ncbi:hypothetical protein F7725_028983, partial [Dissostichus mawsoni]
MYTDGKNLTCSSEGIYPKPEISWSTDSPSNQNLWEKIKVQQIDQLYNINSSLTSVPDVEYKCTVSTGRNKMAATLFKQTSLSGSSTETTMPCTSSKTPPTGLIWRFNHSHIIVSDGSVTEEWRQQVKSVSMSGDLTLKDLSTDHDGIYSCELRNAEGTYVTNTFLRIEQSQVVAEEEVSCVFNESCILPCIFEVNRMDDVVIQWIQVSTGDASVHSFYRNQTEHRDHFDYQDPRFKGRTSLFRDQIFRGNASLKLERVEIPDEGTYKCYTAIEGGRSYQEHIKLKVDAPVLKVDIQQAENKTTCSSEGIYPEPQLTWSIHPPPNETLHNKTTVHQTEQKLYNISSSLNVTVTDVKYICTVSTRRNKMAATLFKLTSLSGSSTETTMPCTSSKSPPTGLIWRFNHSQIIMSDGSVMEEWRQQVKSVSMSGDLTLKDLSTDHDGIYSCELRNAEGTYVTNTFLRIEQSQALSGGGIAGIVVAVLAVLAAVLLVLYSLARGVVAEEEVSCVFNESCILPCIFEVNLRDDVVIQWIQVSTRNASVHAFYHNQDHFERQDPRFKGRTALFRDQIFRGNVSLKLERVEIPDEGTYRCYTSIEGGSSYDEHIKLKVDAPVLKVDIQQAENKTTCSSEGIYPEPQLTWSTEPPPNETLHNKTTVHQTEQKLYNISSSLNVTVTDVKYTCTVSTRRNKMAATLVKLSKCKETTLGKQTSLSGSSTETTMPCTSSKSPPTGLIWRFNHRQIIVSNGSVMEEWRQQVKSVSKSGDLTLKDLSTDHDGIYSCELRNAEGTHVTNTFLRIEQGNVSNLIYLSLLIIPIAVAVGMLVYCK